MTRVRLAAHHPPFRGLRRMRGPVNGSAFACPCLRCGFDKTTSRSGSLCLPVRGLCLSQKRGVMRRKAHTGGASPPKPNGSGDPFLRGRKNCFWLPPALRWVHWGGRCSWDCARLFSSGCVAPLAENCLSRLWRRLVICRG